MKETRQVRRNKERQKKKKYWDDPSMGQYEVYFVKFTRKSQAGIEYIYYKKILDKQGQKKDDIIPENTINTTNA